MTRVDTELGGARGSGPSDGRLVVLPIGRLPGSHVNYCSLASKRKSPCAGLCFVPFSVECEHEHQHVLVHGLFSLHVQDFSLHDELKLTLFSAF